MTRERAERRIEALLALASDSASTPAESELAAQRAAELRAQWPEAQPVDLVSMIEAEFRRQQARWAADPDGYE